MPDNPFDQFDTPQQAAPAPTQQAAPQPEKNPFDQFDTEAPAAAPKPVQAKQDDNAPIIITGVRKAGAPKAQEVNPSYTEQGFDVGGEYQPHTKLTDADKREYASFFTDPAHPPSAAQIRDWYHRKTGAYIGNADEIIDAFKKSGQFSTNEKVQLPTQHQGAFAAGLNHLANGLVADFGPEAAATIQAVPDVVAHAVGLGGDRTVGQNWDINADLAHAQLVQDSADHPVASTVGEFGGVIGNALITGGIAPEAGVATLGRGGAAVARGGVEGAVYGAGSAGPGHRLQGAAGGATLGAATAGAINGVTKGLSGAANVEAADAAQRVNSELGTNIQPTLATSGQGRLTRGIRAGSDATLIGGRMISKDGERFVGEAEKGVNTIKGRLAPGVDDPTVGSAAENLVNYRDNHAYFSGLFDDTKKLAGDTPINSPKMVAHLDEEIASMKEAGIDTKKLQAERAWFAQPHPLRAILKHRTEVLGRAFDKEGEAASRVLRQGWGASREDIVDNLTAAGRTDAVKAFEKGNEEYTNRSIIQDVLGKKSDPDQIATAVINMSNRTGYRLAKALNALPAPKRGEFLAGLVDNLGTASAGKPNAGEFSFDAFATGWSKMKPKVKELFPERERIALNDLTELALGNKTARALTNNSRTAHAVNVIHHIKTAARVVSALGNLGAAGMGHIGAVAAEGVVSASIGKVLTSPRLARVLVEMQRSGKTGPGLTRLRLIASRMTAKEGRPFVEALINSFEGKSAPPPSFNQPLDLSQMPDDNVTYEDIAPEDLALQGQPQQTDPYGTQPVYDANGNPL